MQVMQLSFIILFVPFTVLSNGHSTDSIIRNVPFIQQQEDRDCGPTSLRILLAFDGIPANGIETIYRKPWGTLPLSIEKWLKERHIFFCQDAQTLERLRIVLQAKRPLMVLLNRSKGPIRNYHYVVVVGLQKSEGNMNVLVHDGKKAYQRIPIRRFETWWHKAKNWHIYLKPREVKRCIMDSGKSDYEQTPLPEPSKF